MEVYLASLLCIAPQLRSLDLSYCRLIAERNPTELFASGWDRLQELDLHDSTITAQIGAVRLPWLKQLNIEELADEIPGMETVSNHVSAFAGGCPQCTWLRFTHPSGGHTISCCKDFSQLLSVEVVIPPVFYNEWVQWPLAAPCIELPASVTTLECGSDPGYVDGNFSDLYAVLSMVASNIRAGVMIKALCCRTCAAYTGSFEDEWGDWHFREPTQAQLAALYRPVCRALHGLESLDVSFLPRCGERAVAEVLAAAPDLRALAISVSVVDERLVRRALRSPTLTAVTVHSHFIREDDTEQRALEVDLKGCTRLEICVVKLEAKLVVGDRVAVMLECHEGADIKTRTCCDHGYGQVHCSVSNAAARHAESYLVPVGRRVTVSFQWGPDKAWASEVLWSE
jgi:hypothetical protein